MNNEPNKPVELTEKELEGVVGGATEVADGATKFLVQTEGWTQTAAVVRTAVAVEGTAKPLADAFGSDNNH